MQMVHSRSYATNGAKEMGTQMLVPLADLFNHEGEVADFDIPGKSTPSGNLRWGLWLTLRYTS